MKDDTIITEFLRTLGPWRDHVVIGGGYAPIIYKLYLTPGTQSPPPVGTRDIDSLIHRRTPTISDKNIAHHLTDAGFEQIYKDREVPATEAWQKQLHSKPARGSRVWSYLQPLGSSTRGLPFHDEGAS